MDPINHDSVCDEYSVLARRYEGRWRRYLEKTTARTLEVLDPKNDEQILDLGCGTGLLMRLAAERNPCLRLVGLDMNREMLHRAWGALAGQATLIQANASRLPFPDAIFDAAVISSVLQYSPEPKEMLLESARVLRPGGRIVVTAWDGDAIPIRLRTGWINGRRRARVYAHPGLSSCIRLAGFRLVGESAYSAGLCWPLRTYLAVLTDRQT